MCSNGLPRRWVRKWIIVLESEVDLESSLEGVRYDLGPSESLDSLGDRLGGNIARVFDGIVRRVFQRDALRQATRRCLNVHRRIN